MKKIKSLSLVLSALIATSVIGCFSVCAEESNESDKKLYAECIPLAYEEELLEYLLSNGLDEDEANSIIISYFEGRKKIEESGITLSDPSNPDIPDYVWSDDYDSTLKNYDWTEFTISPVSSTKGTFEGNASYTYNSDTKGLIIDGNGSFTANDYSNLAAAFDIDFLVIGKDVVIPESMSGTLINEWLMGITEKHNSYPVYTYADSDVNKKYIQMMNFMTSNLDCNEEIFKEDFVLNILSDEIKPEDVYFKNDDSQTETEDYGKLCEGIAWFYNSGIKEFQISGEGMFEIDKFLETASSYNVESVKITGNISFDGYLAKFETPEEIEKNLLSILNMTLTDNSEKKYSYGDFTDGATWLYNAADLSLQIIGTEGFSVTECLSIFEDTAIETISISEKVILPAELQNCETIDEAEAELLKLINEAKAEEQPIEETVTTDVETEFIDVSTIATTISVETVKTELTADYDAVSFNSDEISVRDCAIIAKAVAENKTATLPDSADYNMDGKKNVRDAAAIAKDLASKKS